MISQNEPIAPKILLVDDSVEVLDLLEVYLRGEGFDLTLTYSGDEALLAARRIIPDLIVLDVSMPGMDGYEVCERLQQQQSLSYIPVIFATAKDQEEDRKRAFAVGAADYISKPIRKVDLIALIHKHLKTKEQWSDTREQYPVDSTHDGASETSLREFIQTIESDLDLYAYPIGSAISR